MSSERSDILAKFLAAESYDVSTIPYTPFAKSGLSHPVGKTFVASGATSFPHESFSDTTTAGLAGGGWVEACGVVAEDCPWLATGLLTTGA